MMQAADSINFNSNSEKGLFCFQNKIILFYGFSISPLKCFSTFSLYLGKMRGSDTNVLATPCTFRVRLFSFPQAELLCYPATSRLGDTVVFRGFSVSCLSLTLFRPSSH